jgi:hypothetical protein
LQGESLVHISVRQYLVTLCSLSILAGCATTSSSDAPPTVDLADLPTAKPSRTLASYSLRPEQQQCYDRTSEPYTAVVDVHFHPRPFGGQAIPPDELFNYFDRLGVRFVNYFGIGQVLELDSGCTYYLDCPGVSALPSIKNDFVNGLQMAAFPHDNVNVTLSMTFMDLANPGDVVETIRLYDKEYPDMFKWAGELNVMKQALLGNNAEPATRQSIDGWAPFMAILRERGIPVTLHSDLGNDDNPTEHLYLMDHVLASYPDNKIVWAHMGLSKELSTMNPTQHVAIMSERLDRYPNLMLDISWDVLYNSYHEWGSVFIPFFNKYYNRILPGSDFVAASNKDFGKYAHELEVTSRALRVLDDRAFRHIALGENYFRFLGLDYNAPQVCETTAQR